VEAKALRFPFEWVRVPIERSFCEFALRGSTPSGGVSSRAGLKERTNGGRPHDLLFSSLPSTTGTHPVCFLAASYRVKCMPTIDPGQALRLVAQVRARDEDGLAELVGIFGPEVRAVAYVILRNESDAEEVAEDTFVTAWLKIESLRDSSALRPWLMRIASRLALRVLHRSRNYDIAAEAKTADPATELIDHLALDHALRKLPPRMRAVVGLHYIADLTVDEVATTLRRSRNTIKSQLKEALQRMRSALGDDPSGTWRSGGRVD
jgi:RNA polymerase sigma-70 factor (ECF subfamily)